MPSLNPYLSNRHAVVALLGGLVLAGAAGSLAGALTGGESATPARPAITSHPPAPARPATSPGRPSTGHPSARPEVLTPPRPRSTPSGPVRPVAPVAPPPHRSSPVGPVTRLTIDGAPHRITLTVPAGWHPSRTRLSVGCGCGGPKPIVCLVPSGDLDHDPRNCALVVETSENRVGDADTPVPSETLPACARWTTSDEATVVVGAFRAEYREFVDRCDGSRSEQWTIDGTPGVAFWHPITPVSSHDDVVRAIETATIPGRTSLGPGWDRGYLRSLVRRADGVHVTIDRVVTSLNGTAINYNPATYDYLLQTRSRGVTTNQDCIRYLDCSADQLIAWFAKGPHPTDGSPPLVGRLVNLFDAGRFGHQMSFAALMPFRSFGGTRCGC